MKASNQINNQHLLWRAAFGPMAQHIDLIKKADTGALLQSIFDKSSKKFTLLHLSDNAFDGLVKGVKEIGKLQNLSKEEKKKFRRQSGEEIKNLNLRWLEEMVVSEAQLREKMSFFWHGHFACRVINVFFQQELINRIRENSLENFGDLLRGVSKSPAMLSFLNNQQNRKQHPNENFAREVMELFTMGRGNYTEKDVTEAARSFTGWGFTTGGEFVFRENQHDNGRKNFLGKSGNFDGDDILDILLEQKTTAHFICRKICRNLVNEDIDEAIVSKLADRFYQGGYNIKALLTDIFTSEWFYSQQNIGTRIKSPVELLVGIMRMMPMQFENPDHQLLFQKSLGQVLFFPPNVAGWPGGRTWIDSNTIMLRLKIPRILVYDEEYDAIPKQDDDTAKGMMETKNYRGRKIVVTTDWQQVEKMYAGTLGPALPKEITVSLLQTGAEAIVNIAAKKADESSRENFIKSMMINVMSTPEYQLC